MPFTLIKGAFYAKGYSPDGDSLKFMAKKEANWAKLEKGTVRLSAKKHVQLRFEGIDALETHYKGSHQPEVLADAATEHVLALAGFTNVVWGPTHSRVTSADDGQEGYVLARQAERYGRPVAFVFAGKAPGTDGSSVYLDVPLLKQSLNYQLLEEGHAYPTYYEGLFADLRDAMTAAVITAWNKRRGVWPYDWSGGVPVTGQSAIADHYVMMPKLFRRLTGYLAGHSSVSGFKTWLASRPERVLVLRTGNFTNFDDVIEQQGNKVSLTEWPEDLVFRP